MKKNFKILKKGDFYLSECIDLPEAKEVIYSLVLDHFGVEPCVISAFDGEEALHLYHMTKKLPLTV